MKYATKDILKVQCMYQVVGNELKHLILTIHYFYLWEWLASNFSLQYHPLIQGCSWEGGPGVLMTSLSMQAFLSDMAWGSTRQSGGHPLFDSVSPPLWKLLATTPKLYIKVRRIKEMISSYIRCWLSNCQGVEREKVVLFPLRDISLLGISK